jgi:hypothetical protein
LTRRALRWAPRDASAIPTLEALLNSNDLSIEMAPMIKRQIEHLKNLSGLAGAHDGAGAESSDGAPKTSEDERLIHLEQLVEEIVRPAEDHRRPSVAASETVKATARSSECADPASYFPLGR